MTARLAADLGVTMRVPVPDRPDLPLLECLERRRRPRRSAEPRPMALRGELCRYTAPFLLEHLAGCSADQSVVLDVGDVTLVDSAALDLCDDANRRWAQRGLSVTLIHARPLARSVIGVLGLDHLLADAEEVVPAPRPAVRATTGGRHQPGGDDPKRGAPATVSASAPIQLTIRNLEGGRVVEVAAHGAVDHDRVPELTARVEQLIRAREPGELRIDLRDATVDADLAAPLLEASELLWSIGATLVVLSPSPALRQLLPAESDHLRIDAGAR